MRATTAMHCPMLCRQINADMFPVHNTPGINFESVGIYSLWQRTQSIAQTRTDGGICVCTRTTLCARVPAAAHERTYNMQMRTHIRHTCFEGTPFPSTTRRQHGVEDVNLAGACGPTFVTSRGLPAPSHRCPCQMRFVN